MGRKNSTASLTHYAKGKVQDSLSREFADLKFLKNNTEARFCTFLRSLVIHWQALSNDTFSLNKKSHLAFLEYFTVYCVYVYSLQTAL